MSSQPEMWRVSTVEGVFETDLETLKQWIVEGCVLPTDKVSKGNLNWIEAGRAPKLRDAFSGETTEPVSTSFETFVESNPAYTNPDTHSTPSVEPARASSTCQNHPEAEPKYVCRMCGALFCKTCAKLVGNVAVCSLCGDLCHEYQAVKEKAARARLQSSGFGIDDFVRAIGYPLQHKAALIGGALIYGFLLCAGFRGGVLAWVILFGCISHVINQVAWGRFKRSFMPDFSAFSYWDDVVQPGLLGVGITIVSWGPVIALVFALVFGVVRGGGHAAPLTGGYQSAEAITSEDLSVLTDPNADPAKLNEANRKLQETRTGAQIAREADAAKAEASDPAGPVRNLLPYIGARVSIALLLLLFIAWGIFYYPMALTVAGYTQSFGSVVNPLVGLDTIRRMGSTYFKAFGMVMLVYFVAFVIGAMISFVTSPLALPFVGNVVGNFINATFTFYFNLVVACVLGLSLFKCADRLGINVD